MLPLAYSNGLLKKLYHLTWLGFFFFWKCMVRDSQIYPQWGLIWKRTVMIHALDEPDNLVISVFSIHMSSIISSFLPFLWCLYMHNTMQVLLINVDISMETYLWRHCYTIYMTHRDTQRQDVWFLLKWGKGFTLTELKDILFNLTLLNCTHTLILRALNMSVHILNLSK